MTASRVGMGVLGALVLAVSRALVGWIGGPADSGLGLVVALFKAGAASVQPTPIELRTGGDASVLTVHAFERAPDDARFFEPPGVGS